MPREERTDEDVELRARLHNAGLGDMLGNCIRFRPRGLVAKHDTVQSRNVVHRKRRLAQTGVELGQWPERLLDSPDEIERAAHPINVAADLEPGVVSARHQETVDCVTAEVTASLPSYSMTPLSTAPGLSRNIVTMALNDQRRLAAEAPAPSFSTRKL